MTDETPITVLRYPQGAVIADYIRALVGMIITLGPLAFLKVGSVMVYILAGLGALFIFFGFRTVLRHLTQVELSAEGIRIVGPLGRSIRWRDLDSLSLRYYTTRRGKLDGWMLLKVKDKGSVVALDSTIDGFDDIVVRALDAVRDNGVALEESTLANLPAMGIDATSIEQDERYP